MRPLVPALLLVLVACGPDRFELPDPEPPPSTVVDVDNAPGDLCAQELMVAITLEGGRIYCIDRFEAGLEGAVVGNANQGSDDEDLSLDNSTTAQATQALQVSPRAGLSWYQARAACENAGKRMCTRRRTWRWRVRWVYRPSFFVLSAARPAPTRMTPKPAHQRRLPTKC